MDNLRAITVMLLTLGLLGVTGCQSQPTATPLPSPTLPPPATLTRVPTPPLATATPVVTPTAVLPPVPIALPTATALPPATTARTGSGCTNQYAFVTDVSVPDGTALPPSQVFTKTWRIRNTGTCTWGDGYVLAFEKGQAMTAIPSVSVPRTPPGGQADLSVLLTSPAQPGRYEGNWILKNPQGVAISPSLWVRIVVTGS